MNLLSGRRNRRHAWGERLRELTGDRPVAGAEALLRQVVRSRGNHLLLLDDQEYSLHGGACGIWISLPGIDAVWVDPTTTGIHRDAILLHETGHMVSGDQFQTADVESLLRTISSGFKYATREHVQSALARRTYDARVERRAEDFATWAAAKLEGQRGVEDIVLTRMRGSLDSRQRYW